MKYKYTSFAAALLMSLFSTAQTAKTVLKNSLWTGYMSDRNAAYDYTTTEEDTVLSDGLTYLKLFYTTVALPAKTDKVYKGGLRFDETTNRVYYIALGSTEPARILYDFNVQVGDTLKKENGYYLGDDSGTIPVVVSAIDSIKTNDSIWRKQFHFSGIGVSSVVVEGIGNIGRGLLAMIDRVPTGNDTRFGCYKNSQACIYAVENCTVCYGKYSGLNDTKVVAGAVNVYPNPVRDVLNLRMESARAFTLEVFDASGKQVLNEDLANRGEQQISVAQLPAGFYYYLVKGDGFVQPGKLLKH